MDNGAQPMILLVASSKDIASMNIRQQLLAYYDFEESAEQFHKNTIYHKRITNQMVKLITISRESIYYQTITNHFSPQLIVYISRHSSKSGTPTLSVHTPGNLTTQAQKGGEPRKISIAPANAMKETLLEMARQKTTLGLDYEVSYECTHHGPSLDVAAMFVELGSSPTQWKDVKAAEAVAHATMAPISRRSRNSTVAVGIGGPHYNRKFTQIAFEGPVAFGHMIPKHVISHVDVNTIKQCVKRTEEKVETVILDWKGIRGDDKTGLIKTLKEAKIQAQKV